MNRGEPSTVVFVHAHPDDEAIFTGGTLAALAAAGHRTVVLIATSGELGDSSATGGSTTLGAHRRAEAEASCRLLGVDRLVFLDHVDSGLETEAAERPWGAYVDVDLETAARQIADIVVEERAAAIVTYDDHGVYGHPDHVQVHAAALRASDLAGIETRYLATVDREYLHFVESHLVDHAGAAVPGIRPIGSSTVEVTTTVAIHDHLDTKQQAIAAHASQIGADPWLGVRDTFGDVYGYEWYVRIGPAGPIDGLAARPEEALGIESADPTPTQAGAATGVSASGVSASDLAAIADGLATVVRLGGLGAGADGDTTATEGPQRRRAWRLLASEQFDAWLVAWPTNEAVYPHDHGGARAAFSVVEGELTEIRYDGDRLVRRNVGPGDAIGVSPTAVHDVVNLRSATALSVHVYSPPLASRSVFDEEGRTRLGIDDVAPEPTVWPGLRGVHQRTA